MIPIIKSMGARNEKRKSGRKRGGAQSGSAATPARPRRLQADVENSNVGATDSGKRRVLVWGIPRGARDAPSRRLPRRGTVGVPLISMDFLNESFEKFWRFCLVEPNGEMIENDPINGSAVQVLEDF